jgi:hypothetical protein
MCASWQTPTVRSERCALPRRGWATGPTRPRQGLWVTDSFRPWSHCRSLRWRERKPWGADRVRFWEDTRGKSAFGKPWAGQRGRLGCRGNLARYTLLASSRRERGAAWRQKARPKAAGRSLWVARLVWRRAWHCSTRGRAWPALRVPVPAEGSSRLAEIAGRIGGLRRPARWRFWSRPRPTGAGQRREPTRCGWQWGCKP